jgi:DUF971 family protein
MAGQDIWPTEVRLSPDKRVLRIAFGDDGAFEIDAELLRVKSPSAEVRGHTEAERKTVGGKRNVAITAVEPVGNYAVRLRFTDGHDTGIYSWAYLHDLGANREARFAEYVAELSAKGLDRDIPGQK